MCDQMRDLNIELLFISIDIMGTIKWNLMLCNFMKNRFKNNTFMISKQQCVFVILIIFYLISTLNQTNKQTNKHQTFKAQII